MTAPIHHLESIDSTSMEMHRFLRSLQVPPRDGFGIIADFQSAGRGRLGRTWHGEVGRSLLSSWWFSLPSGHEKLAGFSLLPALAVLDMLDIVAGGSCHGAGCKWPNDIRGHGRKLGGVLTEFIVSPFGVSIGIGLNLRKMNSLAEDCLSTGTSLEEMGLDPPQSLAAAALLQGTLSCRVDAWKKGSRADLLQEWLKRCDHCSKDLLVTVDGVKQVVEMRGLGEQGQLLVCLDGAEREIWVDDVFLVQDRLVSMNSI